MPDPGELLERLREEMVVDKVSVTYSVEGRDPEGLKKFSLTSMSVSKDGGGGWTEQEAAIVKALLTKQVVSETYRDAFIRGAISKSTLQSEVKRLNETTDKRVQKLVGNDAG